MAVAGLVVCAFYWLKRGDTATASQDVRLTNPFELSQAFKFGAFFAVVLIIADLAQKLFGNSGLYVSALLAGLTDVDAITLSVAQLTRSHTQPLAHDTATVTITIAALANTVVKGGLAYVTGGAALGLRVIAGFAVIAAVGVGTVWLA
jgi:uncharacterized membrane protein (DUF4010 family)